MIKFRGKDFSFTGAVMVGSMVDGMVQGRKAQAQQERQNQEMMQQQAKMARKTNEALDRVAKAAEKDPSKAGAAAQVMQKSYASPAFLAKAGKALAKGGQTVFEFGKALNNSGQGNQIIKKVGHGLAMGTTMAAGGYLVDKAIQADRKKLTGAPIPKPEEDPGKKKKAIGKAVASAAAIGGTVLAARKGMLGQGFKNLSHGLNSAGKKIDKTSVLKNIGKEYKSGFKEQFIKKDATTGKNKFNALGTAMTVGFAGMGGVSYLGERKQLKDQAKAQGQQKQYSEGYQYQNQANEQKNGSALKKLAIGAAATAGTVATLRRVGPAGIRKGINDMYMTYGKKIAGKNGNKVGNWMMNSGAKEYGKAQAGLTQKNLQNVVKAGGPKAAKAEGVLKNLDATKLAEKAGQARLNAVKSGKVSRKLGEGLLSGVSSMWTGANGKETSKFLNNMAKDAGNSESTRKVAGWLGKHKRTALVGSIAVGSLAFKPFGWGDKAVRGATGAVDKNAFAYEKYKDQQV